MDADGYDASFGEVCQPNENQTDCDDTKYWVYPFAVEDNTNGYDDNCNAVTDGFGLSVVWTPDAESVVTFTIADDLSPAGVFMLGPVEGIETGGMEGALLSNTSIVGAYVYTMTSHDTQYDGAYPEDERAEWSSLTYIYTSNAIIADRPPRGRLPIRPINRPLQKRMA